MTTASTEAGKVRTLDLAPSPRLALAVAFALIWRSREAPSARTRLVCSALSALLEACRASEEVEGSWAGRSPPTGAKLVGHLAGPDAMLDQLVDEVPTVPQEQVMGEEEDETSWTPWSGLLHCISGLAQGRCTECNTAWTWEHEDGTRSVEFGDPLADGGRTSGMELLAPTVCRALADWLMRNCPSFTLDSSQSPDGPADTQRADPDPPDARSTQDSLQLEPGSFLEMLHNGTCWEADEGPLSQQLGKTDWWPKLEAQRPEATPMCLGS